MGGSTTFCPTTYSLYLHTLLTLTTGCIFTNSGKFNSTVFDDIILFNFIKAHKLLSELICSPPDHLPFQISCDQ